MTATVHQFVPNFASGDAIGFHVLMAQRVLRDSGIGGEIFYDEVQAAVRSKGHHYSRFDDDAAAHGAWILYHLSTDSAMANWLLNRAIPFGVYFHNITPPSYFERWAPGAAANLKRALNEMRRLASQSRFALSQSQYSAADLEANGFTNVAVSPVLVDFAALDEPPNERLLARLRKENASGGARWLFVGRVVPNKCQHDLVAAFAVYRKLYDSEARLTIIGGRTVDIYYRSLELMIAELELGDAVELTDTLGEREKVACYRAADVYVSLSEHEGFGVTLLEAMHFKVPVVAFASTAIPEIADDAALLLHDRDPVVVAAAVRRVLGDDALRQQLVEAGTRRVEQFSLERSGRRLVDAIRSHVPSAVTSG